MSIEIDEIKKINLQDGDVLLVSVDHPGLLAKQKDNIKQALEAVFPINKILVLDKGFSLGVITKEDIEALD